jgi:hypothetical protein
VPPIVVYTGAKRPTGSGEAEADAATLKSAKKHKKHGPKAAKAKSAKPQKADKSPKTPKSPKAGHAKTDQPISAQAKVTPKRKATPATQ